MKLSGKKSDHSPFTGSYYFVDISAETGEIARTADFFISVFTAKSFGGIFNYREIIFLTSLINPV
jgi:hypothetical protein